MAAYRYIAFDRAGGKLTGVLDADSSRAARQLLRERGLTPLEAHALGETRRTRVWRRRVPESELCLLTRQWAALLGSQLTMEQSLSALIDQADREAVRDLLMAIRTEIVAGHSLRSTLDRFAFQFPLVYRASVAAGEKSGELGLVMNHLAGYLERRNALRQKTLQALLYPAIVAGVALLVTVALTTYVVPAVLTVFQQGKQTLPWLTRALIAFSAFLSSWGWTIAGAAVAALLALRSSLKRATVRRRWDARLLRLPVLGRYLRTLDASRFASTLSILLASGVPLLVALEAGREVLVRLPLRDAAGVAAERVREGMPLARALAQSAEFPPLLIHMMASGEATGQLPQLLDSAGRLLQADLEHRTGVLTTLLEPALLLVMGGIVLSVVLAIMQPIIEMNQFFR